MKKIAIWAKGKLQAIKSWLAVSKKRQRITAIGVVLIIALAGQIIYSSFAATTEYSQIPEVAKMQKLTEEVIKLTDEYAAMPDVINGKKAVNKPNEMKATRGKELTAKVKERSESYKLAMQYDPQTTANYYLPYTTRDKLPSDAKFYTETAVDIQGYWITGAIDSDQGSRNLVRLQLEDKSRLAVYGTNLPDFTTGAKVRITGIQIERALTAALPHKDENTQALSVSQSNKTALSQVFTTKVQAADTSSLCKSLLGPVAGNICPDELPSQESNERPSDAPEVVFCVNQGEQNCGKGTDPVTNDVHPVKLLVVPLELPGEDGGVFSDGETYNIDEITQAYTKVQNVYSVMSYGKFRPDVTVYPRYTQVESKDFDNFDDFSWDCKDNHTIFELEMAAEAAINRTPGLRDKAEDATDIALLYNKVPCSGERHGSGWAYVGGSGGDTRIKGYTNIDLNSSGDLSFIASTVTHEFGHSIGFEHANAACKDADKKCEEKYLNPYNFMGGKRMSRSKTIINPFDDVLNDSFTANYLDTADSLSVSARQKMDVGWIPETDESRFISTKANEDFINRGFSDSSEEGVVVGSASMKLNALWQDHGIRSIELNLKGGYPYYIEYRPKTGHGIDNFDSDGLSNGILVYRVGELMNGEHNDNTYEKDDITYYEWDYTHAATKEPFKLETGDDAVCVTPTNLTEGSVDIRIDSDCNNVKIGGYKFSSPFIASGTGDAKLNSSAGGIATDSKGNVYVTEQISNQVKKFDKDGNFITKWGGTYGTADNQFKNAGAIAIDSKDTVYVADIGNSVIKKFNSDGAFISKILPDRAPTDIVFDSQDNMYVAYDYSVGNRGMIQKFDSSGNFIKGWGSYKTFTPGDGQFSVLRGIAVDKQGNVYATDSASAASSVQKFDSNGTFIKKWGTVGNGEGQFKGVTDITLSPWGTLYVTNMDNGRLQEFNTDGTLVSDCLCGRAWDGAYGTGFTNLAFIANGDLLIANGRSPGSLGRYTGTKVETKDYKILSY